MCFAPLSALRGAPVRSSAGDAAGGGCWRTTCAQPGVSLSGEELSERVSKFRTARCKASGPRSQRWGLQEKRTVSRQQFRAPAPVRRPERLLHHTADVPLHLRPGGEPLVRPRFRAPQPAVPSYRRLLLGVRSHAARARPVRRGHRWQPRAHVHRMAQLLPEERVEQHPGGPGLLGFPRAVLLPACGHLPRAHLEKVARRPVLQARALPGGKEEVKVRVKEVF